MPDQIDQPDEPHAVPFDLPELATVVVAPTANDAIDVAGGLIARQRSRGVEVTVLDLDRSERDGPGHRHDSALSLLGVDEVTDVIVSGTDDVAVIADAITAIEHCDLIVAPWAGDDDAAPDDAAVACAAQWAAARRGAAVLFGLPPATARALPTARRGERLVRLRLDEESRERWRRALERSADDPTGAGLSAEFFLTPSSPIARGDAPSQAPGLTTGVPPVTAGRSGVET